MLDQISSIFKRCRCHVPKALQFCLQHRLQIEDREVQKHTNSHFSSFAIIQLEMIACSQVESSCTRVERKKQNNCNWKMAISGYVYCIAGIFLSVKKCLWTHPLQCSLVLLWTKLVRNLIVNYPSDKSNEKELLMKYTRYSIMYHAVYSPIHLHTHTSNHLATHPSNTHPPTHSLSHPPIHSLIHVGKQTINQYPRVQFSIILFHWLTVSPHVARQHQAPIHTCLDSEPDTQPTPPTHRQDYSSMTVPLPTQNLNLGNIVVIQLVITESHVDIESHEVSKPQNRKSKQILHQKEGR